MPLLGFQFLLLFAPVQQGAVEVYLPPLISPLVRPSDYYSVTVNGTNCFVYQFQGTRDRDLEDTTDAFYESMAYFGFTNQPVTVEVTTPRAIDSLKILPRSAEIFWTQLATNKFSFTINRPKKLYIEVNNDELHPLMVFAEYPQKYASDPGGGVKYFAGGTVHTSSNSSYIGSDGRVDLVSGDEVYIAGGAVLQGHFIENGISNITIHGPGIIVCDRGERGMRLERCENITLSDYIMVQGQTNWQHYLLLSTNIVANNVKTFGLGPEWTDAWDVFSCTGFRLSNLFLKGEDDGIAIKTTKWLYDAPCRDGVISDSIIWKGGSGSSIRFSEIGNIAEDIHFENIEFLQTRCRVLANGRAPVSMLVDGGIVRNISFTNMYSEESSENFIFMKTATTTNVSLQVGLIEDIDFHGIWFNRYPSRPFQLLKTSDTEGCTNINFEGLYVQGSAVNNAVVSNGWTTSGVSKLTFTPLFSERYQFKNIFNSKYIWQANPTNVAMRTGWTNWVATMFDITPAADLPGCHYIRNNSTGKYLAPASSGGLIIEQPFAGGAMQQWQIISGIAAPGFYCIQNKATGGRLYSDSSASLKIRTPQGTSSEQWQLSLAYVIQLKNKASNAYLSGIDLYGNQTGGNLVTVKSADGTTAQLWQRIYTSPTGFYLKNIQTGLFLWGKNTYGQADSGAAVSCQYDFQWGSQKWEAADNGDGSFGIINTDSGLYLSADGTNGTASAVSSSQPEMDAAKWIIEDVKNHW